MRKFKGLSDFFLNATEEEKREVYSRVIDKSIEMQNKLLEELGGDETIRSNRSLSEDD